MQTWLENNLINVYPHSPVKCQVQCQDLSLGMHSWLHPTAAEGLGTDTKFQPEKVALPAPTRLAASCHHPVIVTLVHARLGANT